MCSECHAARGLSGRASWRRWHFARGQSGSRRRWGAVGSAPGKGQLVHRRRGVATPVHHQRVAVGSWGQTVRSRGGSTGRAGLWFPCRMGFTHPWSRALTDKGAGSWALAGPRHSCPAPPSPSPSPGEALPAPPAPGSVGEGPSGLRTEEAPRRPGLKGGLGASRAGLGGLWIKEKVRSHRKWSSPSQRQAPRPHSSRQSSPEHASRGREPVGLVGLR